MAGKARDRQAGSRRIEKILDAAKARGLRPKDSTNPAAWRGHLQLLLPAQSKLTRGHHAALPWADAPGFYQELRQRPALSARCLEFTILTAARSGEALGTTWSEIDFEKRQWTVPAERMKAGVEHVVPLSNPAVELLSNLTTDDTPRGDQPVFAIAGARRSNMAMAMLLRRMGQGNVTVHGFRSTFRDWAGDATEFTRELVEQALAHTTLNKVERVYRRGTAVDRRRTLMDAWANIFATPWKAPMTKIGTSEEDQQERTDRLTSSLLEALGMGLKFVGKTSFGKKSAFPHEEMVAAQSDLLIHIQQADEFERRQAVQNSIEFFFRSLTALVGDDLLGIFGDDEHADRGGRVAAARRIVTAIRTAIDPNPAARPSPMAQLDDGLRALLAGETTDILTPLERSSKYRNAHTMRRIQYMAFTLRNKLLEAGLSAKDASSRFHSNFHGEWDTARKWPEAYGDLISPYDVISWDQQIAVAIGNAPDLITAIENEPQKLGKAMLMSGDLQKRQKEQ